MDLTCICNFNLHCNLNAVKDYVIDESNKTVYVFALFNTLQNPKKYPENKKTPAI